MTDPRHPAPITHPEPGEALACDRGGQSGVNLQQSRAIGQDPPEEGSRMGREKLKQQGYPGTPDISNDAWQDEEAKRFDAER
ncbi:MAG: hypothetical protein J0I65_27490 [Variovorax sp.]|nr:hypothetical protein [Variovorax sp.]